MSGDYSPTSKTDLVNVINSEWEKLNSLLDGLPESHMVEPSLDGNWSIKDTLAHIAAWERVAMEIIQTARESKPLNPDIPEIFENIDQFNAKIYEENRHKLLVDVLKDFQSVYSDFLAHIESMDENFLFSNLPFKDVENLKIQDIISANTHWHHKEHRQDIQKWLAELS